MTLSTLNTLKWCGTLKRFSGLYMIINYKLKQLVAVTGNKFWVVNYCSMFGIPNHSFFPLHLNTKYWIYKKSYIHIFLNIGCWSLPNNRIDPFLQKQHSFPQYQLVVLVSQRWRIGWISYKMDRNSDSISFETTIANEWVDQLVKGGRFPCNSCIYWSYNDTYNSRCIVLAFSI